MYTRCLKTKSHYTPQSWSNKCAFNRCRKGEKSSDV